MFIIQLIAFQIFIFVVLIVAMRRVISKNVTTATSRLEILSNEYLQKEENLKKEQIELRKKYEETLAAGKKEAEALIAQAQSSAKEEAAKIVDKARGESETIIKRAESCAADIKKELEDRVDSRAGVKAGELIGRILPDDIKKNIHSRLVRDLLEGEGFGKLEGINIAPDLGEVKLVTAYKLTLDETAALKKALKTYLKRDMAVVEETDAGIVAGIVIKMGSVILDGSVVNIAKKIIDAERNEKR